ncbi:MAG: TIGR03086 family metal-binding protein [Actinomycetota bacterium]|nr:TIGR03086 family metal-binding protein [Actinomycetota bacterium]
MSEVIERYQGLAEQFGARVEATPDDKWTAQAPCDEWQARDVVGHVVDSQRRMVASINGGEPTQFGADEQPAEAWRTSYAAVKEALAKPGALEAEIQSPMGPMSLENMIGRLLSLDILVHTWDLARAVGGDEQLDQDAVASGYEGIKPLDAMLRRPGAFGDKIEPPAGADLQTEFLCFLGRRV